MTRPAWAAAWAMAFSEDDGVLLVTVNAPEWGAPIRLAKYPDDIISRGETFVSAQGVSASRVNDDAEAPRAQLTVPNVTSEIGRKVLELRSAPEVTLEIIHPAYPDDPVERYARLKLRNTIIKPNALTGDLVAIDNGQEPVGRIRVTPAYFPALFRVRI